MITPLESPAAWERCLAIVRPALLLAPRSYLKDVHDRLAADGIQAAVARHDTPVLFNWIVRLSARQGISNAAAIGFAERHGSARWHDVEAAFALPPRCSKLRSHWHFTDCGYRKSAWTCARPSLLEACALPRLPARKGGLNQAAFSLVLFIRDVLRRQSCRLDRRSPCDWRSRAGCTHTWRNDARSATGATYEHSRHRSEGLEHDSRRAIAWGRCRA